jgi:hypothetical protein
VILKDAFGSSLATYLHIDGFETVLCIVAFNHEKELSLPSYLSMNKENRIAFEIAWGRVVTEEISVWVENVPSDDSKIYVTTYSCSSPYLLGRYISYGPHYFRPAPQYEQTMQQTKWQ